MAKKKKTNSSHLQKIERAQHRNEYLALLKQFCDQVTDSSVFSMIPSHILNEIYVLRIRSIKIVAGDKQTIPSHQLEEMKRLLSVFRINSIPLNIGSINHITTYDYFTIALTLAIYGGQIKETDYPSAAIVKQKLEPLVAFANSTNHDQIWQDFYLTAQLIGIAYSNLSTTIYTIKADVYADLEKKNGVFTYLYVYAIKPEKIQVEFNGSVRPVFRMGWPIGGFPEQILYSEVKSELLNLPQGKSYPVYIQSHALDRLIQRLDGVDSGYLNFNITESFKNLKACKNKKGEWLFEYALLNKKVGYLVGELVDEKIIIRTFLFLTNNGTPEGEKLHEHTGIMKEDKMYLTIDTLSSFVHSDIKDNMRVMDIFIKAGCQSLFEVDKEVFLAKGEEKMLANLIENYLNRAA